VNAQNAIAALIHDQLGQTLASVFAKKGVGKDVFDIRVNENDSLLGQLTGPGDGPPRISIGFGLDIAGSSVSTLMNVLPRPAGGPFALLKGKDLSDVVNGVRSAFQGQLGLLEKQRDTIVGLVVAQNPGDLREVADKLFAGMVDGLGGSSGSAGPAGESMSRLRQMVGRDVGIALPFATILSAVRGAGQDAAAIPQSVERALLDYFFTADGFKTLDRESVVAPVHVSDVKEAVVGAVQQRDLSGVQLRGLFSKTTAERYLRDIIRVIVESAYDAARGLKDPGGRFATVVSGLRSRASQSKSADAIEKQFVTWFRGFASMAESASMRAVEVGTQGVSEFQTNPLIAAAAGSFAGTVARKLALDAFLALLTADLSKTPATTGGGV